jgi:hypothetical protein
MTYLAILMTAIAAVAVIVAIITRRQAKRFKALVSGHERLKDSRTVVDLPEDRIFMAIDDEEKEVVCMSHAKEIVFKIKDIEKVEVIEEKEEGEDGGISEINVRIHLLNSPVRTFDIECHEKIRSTIRPNSIIYHSVHNKAHAIANILNEALSSTSI